MLKIRAAAKNDNDLIWSILEPTLRAGETYTLPREMTKADALSYWTAPNHETFVASEDGQIVGTYYIRANQGGGGSHVANCGYMTHASHRGRGIARSMCEHSLEHARQLGFRAMQFNFVVSTNQDAVRLWKSLGFDIAGCLPKAFQLPYGNYVDAYVMFKSLTTDSVT
jgi:ribosomal protein S18 acetylase RimI-like enzyme